MFEISDNSVNGVYVNAAQPSNNISPFDLLRQRLNMPDTWVLAEAKSVSRREITSRLIDRIFTRVRMSLGLFLAAQAKPSRSVNR